MKSIIFRRGFMDKLYFYNLQFAWRFTVACFLLNAVSGYLNIAELAVITYGMPVVWGEVGLHTGFIIWKAKTENCRKFKDYSKLGELEEIET